MKKTVLGMVVAVFALAMISTDALAKQGKKPAAEKKDAVTAVTGTLAIVKDDKGTVTGTTITTKSGTVYTLAALTQNVTALDGKEVTAKGEVKDEAGKTTLTVRGTINVAGEKKPGKGKNHKQQ